MEIKLASRERFEIALNRREMMFVLCALNEVNNGIHIDERHFQTRLSLSPEEAKSFHEALFQTFREAR